MTNIPNAASAVKSYCRNARCRSKLSAPVTNPQKAFCVRGCYESFYRSRCRVCEAAIERKAEHQKFCKRPRCKSRFRADPTQFEWSGYPCSGDARRPPRNPIKPGTKTPLKSDRAWRIIAGPNLTLSQLHCALVGAKQAVKATNHATPIKRHHPPINIIGGYKFPDAPPLNRELLATVLHLEIGGCAVSVFQQWQPIYAEHNIPTFPVTPTKTPAVTNYTRMGLPASKALTSRFQNAMALGFMCGRRTKVVLADVDTTDERVLTDFMDRHGKTPVVSRSASGGLHGWYRHNGEGRHIKPFPGLPIDILGGGFAVAPPSQTEKGKYQFIAGGLDDLDRLPTLQNLGLKPVTTKITKLAGMREHDGRNNALFRELGRAAHQVDDFDQLLDCARTKNEQCAQPMEDKEVMATAASVWKMQEEGRNRFGQHGAWFPVGEIAPWAGELDAFFLLAYLRGNNRPGATFMVTNSLADKFGWWVRRLAAARTRLIELGHIRPVRQAGKGHAALFRWTNTKGGENPPPILN